jgi:hypothetical protein
MDRPPLWRSCAWCEEHFETNDEEDRFCSFDCAEKQRRLDMGIEPD